MRPPLNAWASKHKVMKEYWLGWGCTCGVVTAMWLEFGPWLGLWLGLYLWLRLGLG